MGAPLSASRSYWTRARNKGLKIKKFNLLALLISLFIYHCRLLICYIVLFVFSFFPKESRRVFRQSSNYWKSLEITENSPKSLTPIRCARTHGLMDLLSLTMDYEEVYGTTRLFRWDSLKFKDADQPVYHSTRSPRRMLRRNNRIGW